MRPAAERDALSFMGTVAEIRRGVYVVDVVHGSFRRQVLCSLGGRLRSHHIRIVPGDEVEVEVSIYSTDRGRIVFRGRREARP